MSQDPGEFSPAAAVSASRREDASHPALRGEQRLNALLTLIEQAPQGASGYTSTRPSDYEAVTRQLRMLFDWSRANVPGERNKIIAMLLDCIARLEKTAIQAYPNEAFRLTLVKAELLLEGGEPAEAAASLGYVARRPYLVEGDLGLLQDILAMHQRTLLVLGRRDEAAIVAWRDLRTIARVAPSAAAAAFRMFAPALHLASSNETSRHGLPRLIGVLARWRVSLARNSGTRPMRLLRTTARLAIDCAASLGGLALAFVPQRIVRRQRAAAASSGPRESALITRAMGGVGDLIMMTPGLRALARRTGGPVHLAIKPSLFPVFAGNKDVILRDIGGEVIDPDCFREWHNLSFCPCGQYESSRRPRVAMGRVELFAAGMGVRRDELRAVNLRPQLFLDGGDAAAAFFAEHALDRDRPVIGIQLFSRDNYKDYARMGALTMLLAERYKVVVFHHVACPRQRHPNIVPVLGRPLSEALAIFARCDLAVCVDSAFLHVAAALDMPTVALFGPTDGRMFTKHHGNAAVIALSDAFACMPCWRNEDTPCVLTNTRESACLNAIDEHVVLHAIEEKLASSYRAKSARSEAPLTVPAEHEPAISSAGG